MESEKFMDSLLKESKVDYGLCPPPITAEKGLNILIEHFLGVEWYVNIPLSQEQCYTQAIYEILEKTKKRKSIFKKLFSR
jgi:hypothetical protein